MKSLDVGRLALITCAVVALLVGCGGSQPPIGAPPTRAISLRQTLPQVSRDAATLHVLYRFKPGVDAEVPEASLIAVHGVLFGTTASGGQSSCGGNSGCGTAYKVTLSKTGVSESLIYNAVGYPQAALLAVGDALYGTTEYGGYSGCGSGSYSCGTLFRLTPSGSSYTSAILHYFQYSSGGFPTAPLIDVGGKLYGTASSGGSASGGGVAYELGETGSGYRVIHYFSGGQDGLFPYAGLIDADGSFYGTTGEGGNANMGIVYELKHTGSSYKERVVYSFKGGTDGSYPDAALIALHGVLYGTTSEGGGSGCSYGSGCGTVYKVTPTKRGYSESIIYRFRGSPDGEYPEAALTAFGDRLYGTTVLGGKTSCVSGRGCGTIFELVPSGRGYHERILHRFTGGTGGYSPQGGFTAMSGLLYGTTAWGGNLKCNDGGGCGTIFSIEP
jgi:hypothetical protein